MSKQYAAQFAAECCECGDTISTGEPIYFCDDGKLCEDCAVEWDCRCPTCGGQKKPDYDLCYDCHRRG